MTGVVELEKARLNLAIKRGYRNWISQFGESFDKETRLSQISQKTLALLALGRGRSSFFLFDLIMNLQNLGSGFEFNELTPKKKMTILDRHLFLLDRIRFEYMKRLDWLKYYPGEEFTIVELIVNFSQLAHNLYSKTPSLSRRHPLYNKFNKMNILGKKELVQKLIPRALEKIKDHPPIL